MKSAITLPHPEGQFCHLGLTRVCGQLSAVHWGFNTFKRLTLSQPSAPPPVPSDFYDHPAPFLPVCHLSPKISGSQFQGTGKRAEEVALGVRSEETGRSRGLGGGDSPVPEHTGILLREAPIRGVFSSGSFCWRLGRHGSLSLSCSVSGSCWGSFLAFLGAGKGCLVRAKAPVSGQTLVMGLGLGLGFGENRSPAPGKMGRQEQCQLWELK